MLLVSGLFAGCPLLNRNLDADTCIVVNDYSKKVKCLVIHTRYLKNQYITNSTCLSNICIEYTLIRENYEIRNEEEKKYLNLFQLRNIF